MSNIDNIVDKYINEKVGFENFPKGWDRDSVIQFAKSLVKDGATEHGFFDKCVKKISPHMDDPEGFCASVIDTVKNTTFWRTGPKGHKGEK